MIAAILSKCLKVYLSSYPSKQAVDVKKNLSYLYERSNKIHELIEEPEQADIILLGLPGNDLENEKYLNEILQNDLLSMYPEKVFAVSFYRDNHVFLTRGIYESGVKSRLLNNRIRSGCYLLKSFNPAIKNFVQKTETFPEIKKQYLFSFIGRNSHKVRAKIFSMSFSRDDILIENSSYFNVWDKSLKKDHWRFTYYRDVILKSKFSLCPRGFGPGSIRLFESMNLGVSPVIISDEWKAPDGINWNDFSIILKSKDLLNLERIVASYEDDYEQMGKSAKNVYDEYFSEKKYFNFIISECNRITALSTISEKWHWKMRSFYVKYFQYKKLVVDWRNLFKKGLKKSSQILNQ